MYVLNIYSGICQLFLLRLGEKANENLEPYDSSDSKHLPATWETQIRSLGQEDPLEEGMTTHFSILAWTEEPGKA